MQWQWPFFGRRKQIINEQKYRDRLDAQEGRVSTPYGSAGVAAMIAFCWASGLGLTSVSNTRLRTVLNASTLRRIGQCLIYCGEAYFVMRLDANDSLQLIPAECHGVSVTSTRMQSDPLNWRYSLSIAAPDVGEDQRRDYLGRDVFCVKIGYRVSEPWRGLSPLVACGYDERFLSDMARTLSDVANTPHGFFLADGAFDDDATLDNVVEKYRSARGRAIAMTRSVSTGQKQTELTQFGGHAIKLDTGLGNRLDHVSNHIAAATGVHPSMLSATATGTTIREAWRQLAIHLRSVLLVIEDEWRLKIGGDIKLDLTAMRAADLRQQASALKTLVDTGVDLTEAREIVGL